MTSTTRTQNKYDHRLRELIRSTGDIDHAIQLGVPRSTARGWLTSTGSDVVTLDVVGMDNLRLQQEVLRMQRRGDRLAALLRLVIVVSTLSDVSRSNIRIPEGTAMILLLRAIERSCSILPLRVVLCVVRLLHSRYHLWKQEEECDLDDMPSCPRRSSQQLTLTEVSTIKEMVTSEEYRHVPTGTLALLAQRLGKVFASASTWYRLVRIHKWRRLCWSSDFCAGRVFPDAPSKLFFDAEICSAPNKLPRTLQLRLYSLPSFNTLVFSVKMFGQVFSLRDSEQVRNGASILSIQSGK